MYAAAPTTMLRMVPLPRFAGKDVDCTGSDGVSVLSLRSVMAGAETRPPSTIIGKHHVRLGPRVFARG